jgi:hypothetical protein
VAFDLPALRPFVGRVVMIGIDEKETGFGAMDDDPDVCIHPDGPKIGVLRSVKLVKG